MYDQATAVRQHQDCIVVVRFKDGTAQRGILHVTPVSDGPHFSGLRREELRTTFSLTSQGRRSRHRYEDVESVEVIERAEPVPPKI